MTLLPVRNKRVAMSLVIALVLAAVGGGYYFYVRPPEIPNAASSSKDAKGGRGFNPNRAQPVSVAEVKRADVPIWVVAVGTAIPKNLVTVRVRVDGELTKLYFKEGQQVKQGTLLAEIDPRPFQVQLSQASGQLARDMALLDNAGADLVRYRDLMAKDSISKQQLDTQEALVRQYQGTIESDRAQVDSAKLQLGYARITAPISGRIGLRQVDPGNQVRASDANGIGVIAQVDPMTVVFSLPESHLPTLHQRIVQSEPITVEAWDREQKIKLVSGVLLTTDNVIDTATGTIKLKAEFANKDGLLFPNQFVNARLLIGLHKDALVVPGSSLVQGARGPFVYVVGQDSQVTPVNVTPGTVDGNLVMVEGKLQPGSRVVTDGADKLRDGAKVDVIDANARATKDADDKGQKNEGNGKRPGGKWKGRSAEGGNPASAQPSTQPAAPAGPPPG